MNGITISKWLLTRLDAVFDEDAGWKPWEELRFVQDGEPCVWERAFGIGKIIICRGILGPSLVHNWDTMPTIKYIIKRASSSCREKVYPITGSTYTFVIPVQVEKGSLWAIFAPNKSNKYEQYITIKAPKGTYKDLWSGNEIKVSSHGEVTIATKSGIILLWTEEKVSN
ncbi:hypothetical protein [Clostridium lacusfryxellense]|uniref:hypothetical protein n=1 Tax=Clostridium lacusfryxellense TaxID=205328 RepID=UPI001C0C3387|nr:hypothetical protein [Clostridium lacusfryxellense]MBU3113268.1 hypothetical protein [Clostridium lacusfryxellense]